MKTIEIKEQFEQILSDLKEIEDLPSENAVQVAQVILTEAGKDRRAELLREARSGNNGFYNSSYNSENGVDQPATERQKKALRNFKIPYKPNISKIEASALIDEAYKKLERDKEGS